MNSSASAIHKPYRGFVIDFYPDMGRFQVRFEQPIEWSHSDFGSVINHVFGWHDTLIAAKRVVDRLGEDDMTEQLCGGRN